MIGAGGDRPGVVRGDAAAPEPGLEPEHSDREHSDPEHSDPEPDSPASPVAGSPAGSSAVGSSAAGRLPGAPSSRGPAVLASSVAGRSEPRRPSPVALLVAGTLFVTGTAGAGWFAAMPEHSAAGSVGSALATGRGGEPTEASGAASGSRRDAASAVVDPRAAEHVAATQELLDTRTAAVRAGSAADWLAVVDPGATDYRSRQREVLTRIRALRPTLWTEQVVGTEPHADVAGVPAFTAHVRLRYRLAGDTRDVVREQYLLTVRRTDRWSFADDADARTQSALWDLGDLVVRRGRRTLAVGIGPGVSGTRVSEVAAVADAAAGDVDTVWGTSGPRRAVVLVPGSRALMARALGRPDDAALDQVAAVTTGELERPGDATRAAGSPAAGAVGRAGSTGPGSTGTRPAGTADRVVLNPGPFARLTDLGRRVVLTHELTHIATRAGAWVSPPLWVEEGFANWVAYRRSGLRPSVIAGDAVAAVRAGTAPEHLPAADDFDPEHGPIAVAYADAWLAFQVMSLDGAERPVAFYRAAAGLTDPTVTDPTVSVPTDAAVGSAGTQTAASAADPASSAWASSGDAAAERAFAQVLGSSPAAFEVRWRAYRARVAASGSASSGTAASGTSASGTSASGTSAS